MAELQELESYPHHFQRRAADGGWIFAVSPMRGDIPHETDAIIAALRDYLQQ